MAKHIVYVKERLESELGIPIFQFEIGGNTFLYRQFTVGELNTLATADDVSGIEDVFVKNATLYPEDFDFDKIKAGYVLQYADDIIRNSQYQDLGKIAERLEELRALAKINVISHMKTMIITAMPAYKEEELDLLTYEELLHKTVLSEGILEMQATLAGLSTDGIKLSIVPIGQDAPVEKKEQIHPEKEEALKKKLIDQIKHQNRETVSPAVASEIPVDTEKFKDLSIEQLQGILGITKKGDPIAAMLHGQNGGF